MDTILGPYTFSKVIIMYIGRIAHVWFHFYT